MKYYGVTLEAGSNVVRNIIAEHNGKYVSINWSLKKWMAAPALARFFTFPEETAKLVPLTREKAEELVSSGANMKTMAPLPSEPELIDIAEASIEGAGMAGP